MLEVFRHFVCLSNCGGGVVSGVNILCGHQKITEAGHKLCALYTMEELIEKQTNFYLPPAKCVFMCVLAANRNKLSDFIKYENFR
jgi:hypothetical protein